MKKRIIVEGMCCKSCTTHVKEALEAVENVNKVKVSLKKGEVIVKSKKDLNEELLKEAIESKDYKVVGIE
ncbi:MAG TPA: heavy metal transport/detoxification protein [Acholeplasmataceae bacterium]|nr:heavy metal transport/detoxification protein [Acholeplasmataceae bacterium]